MPHEIAKTGGRDSLAYYGEAPWHGLGTRLDSPMTAEVAIREAGLEYEVESVPLIGHHPTFGLIDGTGMVANIRKDDGRLLGVVSDGYKVIQNHEAFAFLDAVVGEKLLEYHTAGALGQGERVWMLAKIPGDLVLGHTDHVEKYLLLSNAHDGSMALRAFFTGIRVVCANTLGAALAGHERGVTIRHTGDVSKKVEEARKILGLAGKWFAAFGDGAKLLAGHRPTEAQLDAYFRNVFPDPAAPKDNATAKGKRSALWGLFTKGIGHDQPGIRETSWCAYNAVTEYVDHQTGTKASSRLESAWWGDGYKLKARAFDLAVRMAEAGTAPVLDLA